MPPSLTVWELGKCFKAQLDNQTILILYLKLFFNEMLLLSIKTFHLCGVLVLSSSANCEISQKNKYIYTGASQ